MKNGIFTTLSLAVLFAAVGCAEQAPPAAKTAEHDDHHDEHGHDHDHDHGGEPGKIEAPVAPSADGAQFILAAAPEESQAVIAARKSAKNDDEIVLTGRIGGSENPWIEGRAMFTMVDESLKSCDQIPGDNCPQPWDYCCATDKLPGATALVKVVGEDGQPIKTDARKLLGVRELTQVVVKGKAQRDDAGNLTVLATGIYVKK